VIKGIFFWQSIAWICLGMASARATTTTTPWLRNERLSYDITCGPIKLGELVLTAQQAVDKKNLWEFKAELVSSKLLNHVIPVDQVKSTLLSVCETDPWRSRIYLQDRDEGKNVVQKIRELNYAAHEGTIYEGPMRGSKGIEKYPLQEASVEDPVSLLYRIRKDVHEGNQHLFYSIIENKKIIQLEGLATRMQEGSEVRVVLNEVKKTKNVKKNKRIEIFLSTLDRYAPKRAQIAWGPFSVDVKSRTGAVELSDLKTSEIQCGNINPTKFSAFGVLGYGEQPAKIEAEGSARQVKISLNGPGRLSLKKVEVYGGELQSNSHKNISINCPTKQSSTEESGEFGELKQLFGQTMLKNTRYEINPWWEVDLGKTYEISEVRIWGIEESYNNVRTKVLIEFNDPRKKSANTETLFTKDQMSEKQTLLLRLSGYFICAFLVLFLVNCAKQLLNRENVLTNIVISQSFNTRLSVITKGIVKLNQLALPMMPVIMFIYCLGAYVKSGQSNIEPSFRYSGWGLALAISQIRGIANDYTVSKELHQFFLNNRGNPIDETLKNAMSLKIQAPKETIAVEGDDLGVVDFIKKAFKIYGLSYSSLHWMFFTYILVSIIVFLFVFYRDPLAIITMSCAILGLSAAIPVLLLSDQLCTVIDPRFMGTLALFPIIHLAFSVIQQAFDAKRFIAGAIQSSIIVSATHIRSSTLWAIICLGIISVAAMILFRKQQYNITKKIALVFWPLILCLLLLGGARTYQKMSLNEKYFSNKTNSHIVYHNILIGFSLHPILAQKYSLALDDAPNYYLLKRMLDQKGNSTKYKGVLEFKENGTFVEVLDWRAYEVLARDMVLEIVARNPRQVAELLFYYKPRNAVNTIRWLSGSTGLSTDQIGLGQHHLIDPEQRKIKGAWYSLFTFKNIVPLVALILSLLLFRVSNRVYSKELDFAMILGGVIPLCAAIPMMSSYTVLHIMGDFLVAISFSTYLIICLISFIVVQKTLSKT
jgi:hypothetical protein